MSKQVVSDLHWVGVFDEKLRVFDIIMTTPYGTTYNSYLLRGSEGCVIFETAKETFSDQYIATVKSAMQPNDKIKYIVLNHTEPDHSGSLGRLLKEFPDAIVVASGVAHGNLPFIAHDEALKMKKMTATNGSSISVGNYTLKFIIAPFLHWPDTMFTYIPELKALITCDFMGAHYCNANVFNDLIESDPKETENMWDAYKYYFDCIFGPFKTSVLQGLDKIKDLDVQYVCCSHGPVLRKDIDKYKKAYRDWSIEAPRDNEVVIAYAAAYEYTASMAKEIAAGIESQGVKATLIDLVKGKPADVIAKLGTCKGLLLGTPTLVADAIPPIWEVALALNPYVHKNLLCGTFGSHGWSGEGTRNIMQRLDQVRVKVPLEALTCRFKPTPEVFVNCKTYGDKFARACKGEAIAEHK